MAESPARLRRGLVSTESRRTVRDTAVYILKKRISDPA